MSNEVIILQERNTDPEQIPELFFLEMRQLSLGEISEISLTPHDLTLMVSNVSLIAKFCELYRRFSQDPEIRENIKEIIRKLIAGLELDIDRYDSHVKTIDIYAGRVSGAAAIGGTGALLYGAVAAGTVGVLGPVALVIGGFLGIGFSVYGRTKFSAIKRSTKQTKTHFEQLLERLEGIDLDAES